MVKLYKDLGKTAKKLLNDDYIYGNKKVQLKTKTSNGVTYTSTGVLSGKDDSLSGDLSCKYSLSGASMTTKLFTSGKMTHETVLDNTGVKGLKLTVLGGLGPKQTLLATGEFVNAHVAAVVAANCLGNPSVHPALTVGMHGVTAGVSGDFDVEAKEMKNIDGVINYSTGKEHEATVMFLNKASKIKFSYSHVMSPDLSVAAEFLYDRSGDAKLLTMGTKYTVDADTTVKAKIDNAGAVSLSYVQEIRKNTTLTVCSKFDVRNLDKPAQQLGLSLLIE